MTEEQNDKFSREIKRANWRLGLRTLWFGWGVPALVALFSRSVLDEPENHEPIGPVFIIVLGSYWLGCASRPLWWNGASVNPRKTVIELDGVGLDQLSTLESLRRSEKILRRNEDKLRKHVLPGGAQLPPVQSPER